LDETLIHFSVEPCGDITPDAIVTALDGSWGRVYLRPGVHRFLYQASCMFELILFTAANRDYAEQILPALDQDNNLFQAAYTRDDLPELYGAVVKDVRRCGRPLSEVVLIDDQLGSFVANPDNAIVIPAYDPCSFDTALADLADVLVEIYHADDVRDVCREHYPVKPMFDARAIELAAEAGGDDDDLESVSACGGFGGTDENVSSNISDELPVSAKKAAPSVGSHLAYAQGQLAPQKEAQQAGCPRMPFSVVNV
jgi:Dullard-like phosphatase family protein